MAPAKRKLLRKLLVKINSSYLHDSYRKLREHLQFRNISIVSKQDGLSALFTRSDYQFWLFALSKYVSKQDSS